MSIETAEDVALSRAFESLEPKAPRVARMQARVLDGYHARSRSLTREWWSLLRARPLTNAGWVLAAVAVLFVTTPLSALMGAFGALQKERTAISGHQRSDDRMMLKL